jgi:hypothetical protein
VKPHYFNDLTVSLTQTKPPLIKIPCDKMAVIKIKDSFDIEARCPEPVLTPRQIYFHHPGYSDVDGADVLFFLWSFDSNDGGLHHGTARTACGIIANNAWDGYLSDTKDGGALELDYDDLLLKKDYWFHVPNQGSESTDKNYPIVPSFRHWKYPHRQPPPCWNHTSSQSMSSHTTSPSQHPAPSEMTRAARNRDETCRITKASDQTKVAHLCPKAEKSWFDINGMHVYNENHNLPDKTRLSDPKNTLLLRTDLHDAMDAKKFVLVPKCGKWVVHMLEKTNHIGRFYQNSTLHDIKGVGPEFLLTRFAWAIFPLVRDFLSWRLGRNLRLRIANSTGFEWKTELKKWEPEKDEPRSKSPSPPTKRTRETADAEESSDVSSIKCSIHYYSDVNNIRFKSPLHCPTNPNLPEPQPILEEAEMAEDIALMKVLPSLFGGPDCEVTNSSDRLWNEISVYPGMRRVERIREEWLEKERRRNDSSNEQTWNGDEDWEQETLTLGQLNCDC